MAKAFDRKLEAVQALRSAADPVPELRKALKDSNNYVVSKAAALAGELRCDELIPDLVAAFDRFMIDPVKSDPQCWAKVAIAKALKDLAARESAVFLRGSAHVQMEPVFGGKADSAATLRGTCTLALVDCPLEDLEILKIFGDRLADAEAPVRVDAALSIGHFGRPEGALLLRLKTLTGDKEPQVLGQCFACLLSLEGVGAIEFVNRFLGGKDEDAQVEAASALAQSRAPEAIELLKTFWVKSVPMEVRRAILISLGASPLEQAAEFLMKVLTETSGNLAEQALRSLAASRFHVNFRDRVKAAVSTKSDASLDLAFREAFPF